MPKKSPRAPSPYALLHALIDEVPHAILVSDFSGRYVAVNRFACEALGYSRARLLKMNVFDIECDLDREQVLARWRVRKPGMVVSLATRHRCADGTLIPVRVRAGCLQIGRRKLLLASATDLREQLRFEVERDTYQQLLSVFFEHSPSACFQKSATGHYQLLNRRCAEVFQMDPVTSLGKSDADLFPPSAAQRFHRGDLEVLSTGRPVVAEEMIAQSDGPHFFLSHKFPIRNRGGHIVSVAGIYTDVTALKSAQDRLRGSEHRYQELVELSPDAVLIDTQDRIIHANQAAARLFNAAGPEELINKSVYELFRTDFHALVRRRANELHRRGGMAPLVEKVIVCVDGSEKHVEVTKALCQFQEGEAIQMILRDLSERRRLEGALLEAIEREQRRFGNDLHDDLGQALTGTALMLLALQQKLGQQGVPEARELAPIRASLVDAIESARALARGFAPDLSRGGLVTALEELARNCTRRFRLIFEYSGNPRGLELFAPATLAHLYRIAQEATTNIARHAGATHACLRLARENADIVLTVSDNGRGLGVTSAAPIQGMGMRSMQYRAHLIGGSLDVRAAATGGTIIECRCPLPETRRQANGPQRRG
ncbi:MAG: PAS domain S-box protein [Steroidobacteraceae bacterium]